MAWFESEKTTKEREVREAYEQGQKAGSEGRSAFFASPAYLAPTDHNENMSTAWSDGYDNGCRNPKK